jgi:hypothetical protein
VSPVGSWGSSPGGVFVGVYAGTFPSKTSKSPYWILHTTIQHNQLHLTRKDTTFGVWSCMFHVTMCTLRHLAGGGGGAVALDRLPVRPVPSEDVEPAVEPVGKRLCSRAKTGGRWPVNVKFSTKNASNNQGNENTRPWRRIGGLRRGFIGYGGLHRRLSACVMQTSERLTEHRPGWNSIAAQIPRLASCSDLHPPIIPPSSPVIPRSSIPDSSVGS